MELTFLALLNRLEPQRIFLILLAAGFVTGIAQVVLRKLSSGNDIDTTAAIWFHAGRLPALRTLASATLSVVSGGNGCFARSRGRTKTSRSRIRQLLRRLYTLVR